MDTLILLYALAGSNNIPVGCFIAAWVWAFFKLLAAVADRIDKDKS